MPNLILDKINFEELFDIKTKSEKLFFDQDPIALGCAVHREWLIAPGFSRWADLATVLVTQQDLAQAAAIRKYYGDRILMQTLRHGKVSEFRRKLYGLIKNDLQLEKRDIGLIYRLPYFFQEDMAIDRVVAQTQPCDYRHNDRIQDQFTLIEQVLRSRKSGDYTQLWLRGQRDQSAYMMVIKRDNPYHRLITHLFDGSVTLSGLAMLKTMSGWNKGRTFYYLADIGLE